MSLLVQGFVLCFLFPLLIFKSLMAVCVCVFFHDLFNWSQGIPAGIGGWVTGMRMGKGGWRKRCLFFHRDRVRGEKDCISFPVAELSWDWEHRLSGAVVEGWVCLQSYLLPCEELFLGWQKVQVRAGSWGKATSGRRGLKGDCLWNPQEIWGKERLQLVFFAKDETGWFVWANREQILIFNTC